MLGLGLSMGLGQDMIGDAGAAPNSYFFDDAETLLHYFDDAETLAHITSD